MNPLATESIVTMTKQPIDIAITEAEYNLLRRMRQVRRQKLAEGIYIDLRTGTLHLVGKSERYDVTCGVDNKESL